ncbi:MAG TPA: Gfo/Idh/MocA family oxidoreductase [Azospirillaceae bacterium]|nr:Gfo/Idh/MocA family oxidoreductase [Azospirillaceae bacterium]
MAVVGCGYWGAKHIRILSGLPEVREVVVVDPDPDARRAIQASFPATRGFPDLASALPHVDAAVIATPPRTHFDLALLALRSGKHVLVEKPLATSLVESRLLVEEARQAGAVLMVGHTFLFVPAVKELRRRMVLGELGRIHYIHSARLNLGLYRSDVNVIWDLAPHDITIMNYLLNAVPTMVSAWGVSLACAEVEDVAHIRLDYGSLGITGYCHLSWLDPKKNRTITVVGRQKMAVYDDLAEERLRIYDRGVRGGDEPAVPYERPQSYRYGDITSPYVGTGEPLALEVAHFVDCVRRNAVPDTPGQDGMVTVAVLEAIDRAVRNGRPEKVLYPPEIEFPAALTQKVG